MSQSMSLRHIPATSRRCRQLTNECSEAQTVGSFFVNLSSDGECLVARCNDALAGFAVVDRSFFDQRFVALLIVDPRHQRQGIGSALMRAVEDCFPGEKLFTSTNASNLKMQALCEQLGFVRSGYIEHLDEGDPEIVYFKIAGDLRDADIPDERGSGKS